MKVTVIGCWGGFPPANGATSCYLVEKDGFILIVDLGSGALAKLQNTIDIMDIDAVILSHYHHDHIADVGVLQYARLVSHYLTNQDAILPIYGHNEDPLAFQGLSHDVTKGIAYHPDETLTVGPFSITFLKTKHGVPCYGMRITDGKTMFVYTADTAYDDTWIDFAKDADMLITDCNFYAHQHGAEAGHMNSTEAALIAQRAQVKELILSHLPQYGRHQQLIEEAKEYYQGPIQLAYDGLVWSKG